MSEKKRQKTFTLADALATRLLEEIGIEEGTHVGLALAMLTAVWIAKEFAGDEERGLEMSWAAIERMLPVCKAEVLPLRH
jgi:hypothetical protein